MLPEDRLSSPTFAGVLVNPLPSVRDVSSHWGPVALQNPQQGLFVRLWKARVVGNQVFVGADGVAEVLYYTHPKAIAEISLAFDQNGNAYLGITDADGAGFVYWWDSKTPGMTALALPLDCLTPKVTLDDARGFNVAVSDVVCAYVRDGVIRYRLQRESFAIEHTPGVGVGGPPATATALWHISMNKGRRLQFVRAEVI